MAEWLRRNGTVATLTLHIQPGARKTANTALIAFVADRLDVSKSSVRLISGQTSRRKIVEVAAAPPDMEQRLLP
jgi:uncharacterized protein YggU (UPF0235/DUF167 family)